MVFWLINTANNCIQLTVISVTLFAKAKKPPLITSADAGVKFFNYMYKILILAYLITQDPIATQQTFQMQQTYDTMEACKTELTLQTRNNGTYDVMWEFVVDGQFKWDWLVAGCKNDDTGEEFRLEPSYPLGKPKELEGLDFTENRLAI